MAITSEPDDQRAVGLRVEAPFISFRIGRSTWGWAGNPPEDNAYERAKQRVRARLGFYRHLSTYAAALAAVLFIDMVTGGGLSWLTLWAGGIWGALLVWQFFNVFVFPSVWSAETEERMIQDELRRQQ